MSTALPKNLPLPPFSSVVQLATDPLPPHLGARLSLFVSFAQRGLGPAKRFRFGSPRVLSSTKNQTRAEVPNQRHFCFPSICAEHFSQCRGILNKREEAWFARHYTAAIKINNRRKKWIFFERSFRTIFEMNIKINLSRPKTRE